MLATFFGLNLVFDVKPQVWMDCGLLFLFYGLYFGVLGRDIAEICADKMAAHIGVRQLNINSYYYRCNYLSSIKKFNLKRKIQIKFLELKFYKVNLLLI